MTSSPPKPLTPAAQAFRRKHPTVARLIERIVMWPYKRRIRRAEGPRLKALEETIETVRAQHTKFCDHGLADTIAVSNAALYVLLFDRDFSVLKAFFLVAESDWEKQFVGRQMAVMLYEGVQDIPNLFGKRLRAILAEYNISEQRRLELDAATSRLATFRQEHADRLKELRNVLGAHRDKDVLAQLRIVDTLDPLDISRIGVQFWEPLRELTPVLSAIMLEIGSMRMLLRQMVKRHAKK